jgi:hypothetical protein
MPPISYARHQFPPAVIQQAVWLYLRFTLSYRDGEDLLAERGLNVTYERNDPPAGPEVRAGGCPAPAAATMQAEPALAPRRDRRADRWAADVPVACRPRRG